MLTTIDQFAGQDIWVYAELEYEDAYIRIEKVFDSGTVIYNAWLPSDSLAKYDLDEILYGELTGDVDSIEIHPLDTLTTDELIAKIEADGGVTASKKFTKYPQGYVKADIEWDNWALPSLSALQQKIIDTIESDTVTTERFSDMEICCEADIGEALAEVERLVYEYYTTPELCEELLAALDDIHCDIVCGGWRTPDGEFYPKTMYS